MTIYSLVVISTNPGCSSDHGNDRDDHTEHTPCEYSRRGVVKLTMLECADDGVDEPCDSGCGTARVYTTEML
jgi:hypothetical protein